MSSMEIKNHLWRQISSLENTYYKTRSILNWKCLIQRKSTLHRALLSSPYLPSSSEAGVPPTSGGGEVRTDVRRPLLRLFPEGLFRRWSLVFPSCGCCCFVAPRLEAAFVEVVVACSLFRSSASFASSSSCSTDLSSCVVTELRNKTFATPC